jgi:predicted enzyme related to lactoylglutathione lyase
VLRVEITVVYVGVTVRDYPAAVDWYSRLFGRPADLEPFDVEVMWRLTDGSLFFVLHDPDKARPRLTTIGVADVVAAVAEIAGRGIQADPVEDLGASGRQAVFHDGEGNAISLIQVG